MSLGKFLQLFPGTRVVYSTTGNNQRALCRFEQGNSLVDAPRVRQAPLYLPGALRKEGEGIIVGLRLHVLGQRQGNSPSIGRIQQNPHGFRQRGKQLFGAGYAIEETADGTKAIVDTEIGRNGMLQLL